MPSNPIRIVGFAGSGWVLTILLLCISPLPSIGQAQTATRQVPVDSLIYDLKNPDPIRRKEAATQLGLNKVQRAVPDLVAAAGDPDASVRREIVLALDRLLDIRALPAFILLSNDTEKDIRDRSIQGLINLYLPQESGLVVTLNKMANFFNPWSDEWSETLVEPGITVDPAVNDALRARLQDGDDGLRIKAARGLGILRSRDSVQALLEALRNDRNNAVRFESVRALRKIGDANVAKDLVVFTSYNDARTRNEAIYTIGRYRYHPAVAELSRLYETESASPGKKSDRIYREYLIDALAFIANPASRELFLRESKSSEYIVRLHALEGLARLGDPSLATEISRDRLGEKDAKIRTVQAYALFRMGRKEYLDELVRALGTKKSNQEARQYLVELRPEEMPDLYAQIKNNDVNVREALADILGMIGDSAAIPVLQELSRDRRGQISALANQAMRRITAKTAVN